MFIGSLIVCLLLVQIYQSIKIADLRKRMVEFIGYASGYEIADEFVSDVESDSFHDVEYEHAMNEREQAFEERIARIKDELGQSVAERPSGSEAEILHPGIENLPHDSIIEDQHNPPDIEYAI